MSDERRAAREAAAATCAARLVGKGYTVEHLVTIAFLEGVARGVEEAYAVMEALPSQGNPE